MIDKRPGSEEANLIINELLTLEELPARYTRGIRIRLIEQTHGQRGLEQLYEILRGYPGACEIQLKLDMADGRRVTFEICESLKVEINPEMRRRVEDLIGPENFQVVPSKHQSRAMAAAMATASGASDKQKPRNPPLGSMPRDTQTRNGVSGRGWPCSWQARSGKSGMNLKLFRGNYLHLPSITVAALLRFVGAGRSFVGIRSIFLPQ